MTPNSPAGYRRDPGVMRQLGIPDTPAPGPWKVQLTDLTTKSEITEQPGIEGHRVEKEIRLKLTIRDVNGNEVKHPVWVELALGGTQPGKLILDPDGTRTECDAIGFVWHERDGQGIPKENGTIGYRLGTKSVLTGFLPDAAKSYGVKPAWADMEALRIRAMGVNGQGEVDDSTFAEQFFAVRPEPGKPESLVRRNLEAQILPDELRFWNGMMLKPAYGGNDSGPHKIQNLYLLEDRFGNVICGETNATASSPQANVQTSFVSQAPEGRMSGHYYSMSVSWKDTPSLPVGDLPITLAVAYPSDPDWSAGVVTKTFTLKFDGSVQRALVKPTYSYDLVKPDGNKGTDDGTFPLSVSPGSTQEGLPKTAQGDTPRLNLLTIQGDQTVGLYEPKPEPTLTSTRMWVADGPDRFRIQETKPTPTLDATPAAFKITLVDEQQKPVAEGEFLAHVCPRFDHESAEAPRPCERSPTRSTNGTVESVSTLPGWGYLGVELTKAPIAPGTYYVKVESIGQTHRIRIAADRWDEAGGVANEFAGSFGVCQVAGGEFLDENFQRIARVDMDGPQRLYLRAVAIPSWAATDSVELRTMEYDSSTRDVLPDVRVTRLGRSAVYLSEEFSLEPPGPPPVSGHSCGPTASSKRIKGTLRPNGQLLARVTYQGPPPLAQVPLSGMYSVFAFVDTTSAGAVMAEAVPRNPVGGNHPNLLFAPIGERTTVTIWARQAWTPTAAAGLHLIASLPSLSHGAFIDEAGQKQTAITVVTDANGWAHLVFESAPVTDIPSGDLKEAPIEVRLTEGSSSTLMASTVAYSYASYDFRALPLTLSDLTQDISAPRIQKAFESYCGRRSFLADFYFRGDDGFLDTSGSCRQDARCEWAESMPLYKSPDCRQDESLCTFADSSIAALPASEVFREAGGAEDVSPLWLLIRVEGEQGLLSSQGMPDNRRLDRATGNVGGRAGFAAQLFGAAERARAYLDEDRWYFGADSAPVPEDGPFFFFTAALVGRNGTRFSSVPIEAFDLGWTKVFGGGPGVTQTACQTVDEKIWPRYNVAFSCAGRADYVIWRYNPWVQLCKLGGGQRELALWLIPAVKQALGN